MIRKKIKKIIILLLKLYFPKGKQTIVVASTGRAGSTILYDSILDGYITSLTNVKNENIKKKLLRPMYGEFCARLSKISPDAGKVIKTHDELDKENENSAILYIFVYGDPLEAVMSFERLVAKEGYWIFRKHQYHLKAKGEYSDRYHKDVFNFEGQIRKWMSHKKDNVFVIRYDDLWCRKDELEEFVGFSFRLPDKRERTKKVVPDNINYNLFQYLRNILQYYESSLRRR